MERIVNQLGEPQAWQLDLPGDIEQVILERNRLHLAALYAPVVSLREISALAVLNHGVRQILEGKHGNIEAVLSAARVRIELLSCQLCDILVVRLYCEQRGANRPQGNEAILAAARAILAGGLA